MPSEGLTLQLAYRLLDPNSGAVVVPDLFHIGGTWTVRALLAGYPGSSTIGDFRILLPPPRTEEFRRNQSQYSAILNSSNKGIGLKVEGYAGGVVAGTPVVSGVITKMNLPMDGPWELSGLDTLYWLQQSQLVPGEVFAAPMDGALPTGTMEIVRAMTCTQEAVWHDDFTNWNGGGSGHTSSDYTGNSTWSFTASDPYNGVPALTTSTTSDGYILSGTSWSIVSGQYSFGTVTTHGTMKAGAPGTGSIASEASLILLSDSTWQNGVLCQVTMVDQGTGLYNVFGSINTKSSGTYTAQTSTVQFFTNVKSPFPFSASV